jgi:hypothetical protein
LRERDCLDQHDCASTRIENAVLTDAEITSVDIIDLSVLFDQAA